MKKYIYLFAFAALAFTACSKEATDDSIETIVDNHEAVVYRLTASVNDTKATIEANGSNFTWEEDDEIVVWDSAQNTYQTFTASEDGAEVEFTFTATDGLNHVFTDATAYYPATRWNGSAISTPTILSALKDVPMSATRTGNGNIVFDYDVAVVDLTIHNVPSFATSLNFASTKNSVNITVPITHTSHEDMNFLLAISTEGTYTDVAVSLSDGTNTFFQKTGVSMGPAGAVAKGDLLHRSTTVGPIFTFSGSGLDVISRIQLEARIGDGYGSDKQNWALYSIGDLKYFILEVAKTGWYEWLEPGVDAIEVCVYNGTVSEANFIAKCTYIYVRNADFTIDTANKVLYTDYRVYPFGSTDVNSLFTSYPTGTYAIPKEVKLHLSLGNSLGWSTIYAYAWGGDKGEFLGTWRGTTLTNKVLTLNSSDVLGHHFNIKFSQPYEGAANETSGVYLDLRSAPNNRITDIYLNAANETDGEGHRSLSWTSTTYAPEIIAYPLGTDPGYSITIPTSFDATTYVPIPNECNGMTLDFVFKGGTADVNWNNITINRDFYYEFK